mgnify:CR=1 FL=1
MAVKFTEKAEKVLQLAGNEANRLGHGYIGTEHILWALLHQPDSVAVQAIQKCDRTTDELLRSLRESLDRIPSSKGNHIEDTPYIHPTQNAALNSQENKLSSLINIISVQNTY